VVVAGSGGVSAEAGSPRVIAAVLTYDGRELLEIVLPSLAAQSYRDFRVVVVDNGSSDDSVQWLQEHWPQVEIVALPENVGVTAALNVCLLASDSELVALLNNDVELHPDCLGELVAAMDAQPQAAAVAPKLVSYHERTVLDGTGDTYAWSGEATRRGNGLRDEGQFDAPGEIFGACGGAALYRRSAIERVGTLDEDLFACYEDVDWSFRARLQGYGCRYAPAAVAYHMGGATIGHEINDATLYLSWRNAIWIVVKNYPGAALVRHAPELLLAQAHHLVWALQTRRLGVFLRVWRDALRGMPGALRKRRAIQRSRSAGLAELEPVIGVER
jgi:GT2 family glycosyltransferase